MIQYCTLFMFQIQLKFKGQSKQITVSKSLPTGQLEKLIAQCFSIKQKVIGVTNKAGCFLQLNQFNRQIPNISKDRFSLVTSKDVNQDSMSFASQYYHQPNKQEQGDYQQANTEPSLELPETSGSKILGTISDLELFEDLCLTDKITVVACYTKVKPSQSFYSYYLYQNDVKNSLIIYSTQGKVCEFFVNDWTTPNQQINIFMQGVTEDGRNQQEQLSRKSGQFKKREKIGQGKLVDRSQEQNDDQASNQQIKQELVQKFSRLFEEGELSELQFYKLKSQVLENPQDFMRKYQMGTRQQLRSESRAQLPSKQQRRDRQRSGNRAKRYQIPIIVRKYNNVVQKISTSYPLTLQQQQAINLILEIELKGLITQKEAGKFKSLILQEDNQTFKLFRDYFEDRLDQIQLASRLRRKKGSVIQDSKQRVQHNMRLLIKHSKQHHYELLRKLALEENKHVLLAIDTYRNTKNVEQFSNRLQKIALFYKAKEQLQDFQE